MCRDEIALIEQRTALICQLRAALGEYYPTALEAFEDWTWPSAWAFVEAFPTPDALLKAGKRQWEKFLHTHKLYRPDTYEKRLSLFVQAQTFCGSAPTTQAKSMLAVAVAAQLRVLESHLDKFRGRIRELFAQHPDHELFGSLPGAGEKLAPRLLAELGDDRERFDSPEALQCYAGTAPVTYQSGQIKKARFRRACQKVLRQTVHLWANLSRTKCPWAEAYYQKKREEGSGPRLCPPLPGAALAEDPVEDVAEPDLVRCGASPTPPAPTRELGAGPDRSAGRVILGKETTAPSHERGVKSTEEVVNKNAKEDLANRENILTRRRVPSGPGRAATLGLRPKPRVKGRPGW